MHTDKAGTGRLRHRRTRYVATCQQLLVLGVVFAALIPAATVVSLDVVRPGTAGGQADGSSSAGALAAYVAAATTPSAVPAGPVDAVVKEVALTPRTVPTGVSGRRLAAGQVTAHARLATPTPHTTVVTSTPQPVTGFGTVGVTWAHGVDLPVADLTASLRTRTDGVWTGWKKLDYDVDGPDADSADGRRSRPGTMEALVGHVDDVQVRLAVTGATVPADMKLAVIDPGTPTATAHEKPAIDTGAGESQASTSDYSTGSSDSSAGTSAASAGTSDSSGDEARAVLAAAAYTPKPQIYSRAQWGADEKVREQTAPSYFEVHGGFVHHTVNANDYTRAEVPGIIRSIYAYHVKSRGWRDIGYNFLIDKFGRIWEGRYGGVARPVVGAHTENYNDYGFGVSAIGNFETARPTSALIQAEGALFAWKLSLHGVAANATNVRIGSKVFPHAIEGHRDTKATACPGKYLYAKIPEIRTIAASLQKGWSGRELQSDLAATKYPDLIARRHSDGRLFVIPTGGLAGFRTRHTVLTVAKGTTVVVSPDLTGDDRADLVSIASDGVATTRPGKGEGAFGAAVTTMPRAFRSVTQVAAAGDLDGDGRNDLVARTGSNKLAYYLGNGRGGVETHVQSGLSLAGFSRLASVGDLDGDGHVDLAAKKGDQVYLFRGIGDGRLRAPTAVASPTGSWAAYGDLSGVGDFNNDGHSDLFVRDGSSRGWVFLGNGAGGFQRPLGPYTAMSSAGSVVGAAQLTGNLLPDLLVRTGTTIALVPSNGRRNLAPPINTGRVANYADAIFNAGDWDRDGDGDVLLRSRTNGDLYLLAGSGNGRLGKAVRIATGFGSVSQLQVVGDVTGDGWPDLQGQRKGGALMIWPGRGRNGVGSAYRSHSAIAAKVQIAAGRWNADGAPDSIFRADNRLTLYPGNGPGGLTNPTAMGIDVTRYNLIVGVANLTGGSFSDLVARQKKTAALYALRRTSSGGIAGARYLGSVAGFDLIG